MVGGAALPSPSACVFNSSTHRSSPASSNSPASARPLLQVLQQGPLHRSLQESCVLPPLLLFWSQREGVPQVPWCSAAGLDLEVEDLGKIVLRRQFERRPARLPLLLVATRPSR